MLGKPEGAYKRAFLLSITCSKIKSLHININLFSLQKADLLSEMGRTGSPHTPPPTPSYLILSKQDSDGSHRNLALVQK